MKTLTLLLLMAWSAAFAGESKAEKDLRTQIANLREAATTAARETADCRATSDKKYLDLLRENAKLNSHIRELGAHNDALTVERDALKTQLKSEAEIARFQSRVITAVTSQKAKPPEQKESPRLEQKLDAHQAKNVAALDRNADLTIQVSDELLQLRKITGDIVRAQTADRKVLSQHSELLQRQNATDNRLFWLSVFVAAQGVLMILALIYYFRYVHE